MRNISILLIFIITFGACKPENKETNQKEETKEFSVAEKIANAHGIENWKKVSEVRFTFRVDRDTIKGNGRSWVWNPKSNEVSMIMGDAVISYTRHKIDSTQMAADRAFINDKFWLLIPFQLVWDTSTSISESKKAESPIAKSLLDMITITYPNEGGYTPGDAYDIYYDNDYLIKEWTFRKGNSIEPTLSNTFENYKDFNGIKIAIDHKRDNGNWNLNFTDVSITLD